MDKKPKGALKMRNIPTDIYIENGAVKNHGDEIAELGKKSHDSHRQTFFCGEWFS